MPLSRRLPWPVMSLAASLFACVIALGIYGANLDGADFVPRKIDPAMVHVVLPPKQRARVSMTGK